MKHTPGPWVQKEPLGRRSASECDIRPAFRGHNGQTPHQCFPSYRPIATVKHDRRISEEESRANAALIACAPEMLEALIHANEWSKCNEHDPGRYADLIAKATGQKQESL